MSEKRPRCPYCQRPYTGKGDCCHVCARIIHDALYNPSWDKDYTAKVGVVLAESFGEWVCHLSRKVGGTSRDVEVAVRMLRGRGFVVDSRHPTGYRLTGFFGWERTVGMDGAEVGPD